MLIQWTLYYSSRQNKDIIYHELSGFIFGMSLGQDTIQNILFNQINL